MKIPYTPSATKTLYSQEFGFKKPPQIALLSSGQRDFFNPSNEHKIINPHKIEGMSHSKSQFLPADKVEKVRMIKPETSLKTGGPIIGYSEYSVSLTLQK